MSLGIPEIILILIVVLLIFGADKIPELAHGIGKAEAEYKKAKAAFKEEINASKKETTKKEPAKRSTKAKATSKTTSKKVVAKKTTTRKTSLKTKK